jgi:hypothetical protein
MSTDPYPSVDLQLPHILESLNLPRLTSLCVRMLPGAEKSPLIFPISFGEHLPNLARLPDLRVNVGTSSDGATFQSPFRATLKYFAQQLVDYGSNERLLWEGVPLYSVRRLTANMGPRSPNQGVRWLCGLLGDLKFLEHLELGGKCDGALRCICDEIEQRNLPLYVQTMTVHHGEQGKSEAQRLKHLANAAGVVVTLICTSDP